MISLRRAEIEDADSLALRLREWDRREMDALAQGLSYRECIAGSIQRSVESIAAVSDGVVVAVGGVGPNADDLRLGHPWLLGSDELTKFPLTLVRSMKQFTRDWIEFEFNVLSNWVAAENEAAVRLLSAIGFDFVDNARVGGVEFMRFEMVR